MTFFPRLPSSTSIGKHWEAELEALKGNNAKLTAALLESTANVKQWKQQLAAYQEEAERLHKRVRRRRGGEAVGSAQDRRIVSFVFQVTELECVSSQTTAIKSQKTELNQTIEELEAALRSKEEVRGGDEGNGRLIRIFTVCVFVSGITETQS